MSGSAGGPAGAGQLMLLLAAVICIAAPDADHAAGVKLLREGDYRGALKKLEKACRAHPDDARIAFDYARVAPCSAAAAVYTKLSGDPKTPDSLRAASYKQLGDYSFVHSAFKTAAEKYRLASTVIDVPAYRHLQAFACAAMHDTASARTLWLDLTSASGSDYAIEAQYHLGLLDMKAGAFDSALKKLTLAGAIDTTRSWTIAAAAAKLECALRLGRKDSMAVFEKKLQPYRERLLEKDLLDLAGVQTGKKPATVTAAPAPEATTSDSAVYTLQVGAFGSLDNAAGLQQRLATRFGEVAVLPVTLSEQVFYRVRIGTFKSKADAEAFGNDSLAPEGIAFKAVVK
jgi:tetratricopeptide (TPR) repeat protein